MSALCPYAFRRDNKFSEKCIRSKFCQVNAAMRMRMQRCDTPILRKCFTANIFSIIIFHTLINFVFLISEYNNGKTLNNSTIVIKIPPVLFYSQI